MLFAGFIFFLFLSIFRPQDFVPGLVGTRLVLYTMGFLLVGWMTSSVDKRLFRAPQDKFVALFLGAIIISTLSVDWLTFTVDTSIAMGKTALIYFFIITVVDDAQKFKTATWAILIMLALVALSGVLAYYGMPVWGATRYFSLAKEEWAIKGVGMFDNPNDLAYSVAFIIPFAISYILKGQGCLTRFLLLSVLGVVILCVYYTRSRGGWLAAGVSTAVWFWFWLKSPKWRKRFAILVVGVIVVLFSMQTQGYRDDDSSMNRIEAWDKGVDMLRAHPLIGVGFDQFYEYAKIDSHNSYVRAAAELGLLGLYAFVGILFCSVLSLYHLLRWEDREKWRIYYAGYAGYFAAYLSGSIFSTRTYDGLFLIIVALVSVFGRMEKIELGGPLEETFTVDQEDLLNRKVIFATLGVLVGWKFFLASVW